MRAAPIKWSSSVATEPPLKQAPRLARLGLGRLPGDIFIQRDGFTFYAPITTGILLSVALSLILWLFSR